MANDFVKQSIVDAVKKRIREMFITNQGYQYTFQDMPANKFN